MNTEKEKEIDVKCDIGECPYCKSENIYRDDKDFDCDGGWEIWECDDCKRTWTIYFKVHYVYHTVVANSYKPYIAELRDKQIDDILKE